MKTICIFFYCLFTVSKIHAQIVSYPIYKYGDGTNKPFDKEFDLLIPFKKQESIYYDHVYLYRHKGNRSLRESIGKTKPPTIKLNANWENSKTSDSVFLKLEFRYNPDSKEYSLLKPSGVYSIIIFNGVTKKSKSLVKALRDEYTSTGDIQLDGPASIEFDKITSQQKLDIGINTYNEDFSKYIDFFKNKLIPKETEITTKTKEDLCYTYTCDGNFFGHTDLSVLLNLAKGVSCNTLSVGCFDTCKVTKMIPLLNSLSCSNILGYTKGYTVLSKIGKNDEYAKHDNFELRRKNLEFSLNELNDLKSITLQLRTQLQTIQKCKDQLSSIAIIDSWLTAVIDTLFESKKRVLNIIKLKSELESIYIESRLFIDVDITEVDTYIYNFQARNEMAITPVFGYAFYGFQKGFSGFTPYLGFQVNFQGMNRNDPFNQIKRKTIWQRTCFTTAWTLTSVQEVNKRDDLFDKSSLITALGYKLSHVMMLNAGVLWFKKENPNVLITDKSVAATPVLSLSLNLEIEKLLNGFTKLIPKK
jgi:hypothetical protein